MNKRMMMKRRQEERKKIHKILDLAMEKNKGKSTVFFGFSGHINSFSVDVHRCGWDYGSRPDEIMEFHIGKRFSSDNSLDNIISYLEAL